LARTPHHAHNVSFTFMDEQPTNPGERFSSLSIDPNATCSECGASGAFDFGHIKLCTRCYSEKGSCCAEFGKDDLGQEIQKSE
jgi:hypothetical protein